MTAPARVGKVGELWPDEMKGVTVRGVPVLLVNVEGRICAYRDRCAHLGQRLSKGDLQDGVITCRFHRWQYDAATGEGSNPNGVALHRLDVSLVDGEIWVDVGGGGA